jgi:hypothetical protein
MLSAHAILIGTCGWQYPQWDHTYYPEGLPEDWRLAYYGNEYPVVLIPAVYWAQGRQAIDSWLQETESSPRFICEWTFDADKAGQACMYDLIAALGDRVEGIVLPLNGLPDSTQMATITDLLASYPVCLDWRDADSEQLETLLTHPLLANRIGICWHGEPEKKTDLEHGPLVLARVASAGQTPRSLRTLLESLLGSARARPTVLLFDGQPPDLDVVDQAQVIMNLL